MFLLLVGGGSGGGVAHVAARHYFSFFFNVRCARVPRQPWWLTPRLTLSALLVFAVRELLAMSRAAILDNWVL